MESEAIASSSPRSTRCSINIPKGFPVPTWFARDDVIAVERYMRAKRVADHRRAKVTHGISLARWGPNSQ